MVLESYIDALSDAKIPFKFDETILIGEISLGGVWIGNVEKSCETLNGFILPGDIWCENCELKYKKFCLQPVAYSDEPNSTKLYNWDPYGM